MQDLTPLLPFLDQRGAQQNLHCRRPFAVRGFDQPLGNEGAQNKMGSGTKLFARLTLYVLYFFRVFPCGSVAIYRCARHTLRFTSYFFRNP